jgi:excisionase family DNA binding protein
MQEPNLDNNTPEPIAWSVAQGARALGLSVDTTYKLIRAGRIPARRVGGRLLVPARRLTEWINDPAGDGTESLDEVT